MEMKGFKDCPVENSQKDLFKIESYIKGLVNFISLCETPMTIAIQGDWGSGKTSIMNMVKTELPDTILPIWFNTWEYSQFNMDENLAVSFLTYLSEQLDQTGEKSAGTKILDAVGKIGRAGIKIAGAAVDLASGGGGGTVNEIINEHLNVESVRAVHDLKKRFQEIVDNICNVDNGKKINRIVFFIDDLDRLQPIRAVELLEILKLFLDCEKCIFVLAIDYDVVSMGIHEKYNGLLDDKKGKKFFEKIIQVPFKVPVAHYNIEKYIEESLKAIGIYDSNFYKKYEELIEYSIGCNPRTMKRAFNAYLLLSQVHEHKSENTAFTNALLFGCLCMQQNYEQVYNYIVTHLEEDEMDNNRFYINADFFNSICENGVTPENCGMELYSLIHDDQDYDDEQLAQFLKTIGSLLKVGERCILPSAVEQFKEVIGLTSITVTRNIVTGNNIVGKGARKTKVFDEKYSKVSPNARKAGKIKSFNGMRVARYYIDDKLTECENDKINMSDFLAEVLEYAFEQSEDQFMALRDDVISKGKYKELLSLFVPAKSSSKRYIKEKIEISCYSSNDTKMSQICKVFELLGMDIEKVSLEIKEAHDKND